MKHYKAIDTGGKDGGQTPRSRYALYCQWYFVYQSRRLCLAIAAQRLRVVGNGIWLNPTENDREIQFKMTDFSSL